MSFCANTSVTETVITSQHYRVKIHPPLCLWLRNSTNHKRAKFNTYVSGNEKTRNKNPLTPRGDITASPMQN